MPTVPFHYVDLRAFAYATEDEKRVADALRTFLPEQTELDRVENVGHHGDRIVVLSARIENADGMRHVLDRLSGLDEVDRVIDELDQRVDDNCALFLRVDKQAAFRGEVRLGPGITVRAKVEAYPAKKEAAVENARETLGRLADGGDDGGDGDNDSTDDAAGDGDSADEA
jgi:RNA binding exosome subunit